MRLSQLLRVRSRFALPLAVWASMPAIADPPPQPYSVWYCGAAVRMAAPPLTLAAQDDAASQQSPFATAPARPETETEADNKPQWLNPLSFSITYGLWSDYVTRGWNLSEYPQEGREDPNHQVTTSLGVDLAVLMGREAGECGVVTFDTFIEWYAGQDQIDVVYGAHNCQEIDYTVSYSYEFVPLFTTFTLGYAFYGYPNHNEIATQEWLLRVDHNDAWIWKAWWPENEDGVLNPYVAYWQDTRLISRGGWWQFGVSHDFEVVERVTLTPTIDFGVDQRWLNPNLDAGEGGTHLATVQYGLTLSYDMTELIGLKAWGFGSVVWSGFLYFSDAVGNAADERLIRDELYGGASVGWSF